jgi:hypothetical protein
MTHADLIESKGTATIATVCGVPPEYVRVWKNRRIPRSAYGFLVEAFADVTMADLIAGEPVKAKAA